MSAIAAIFSAEGAQDEHLRAMKASLEEYPHDESGIWKSGPIGLVASIRHTTAESREQGQPNVSEDGQRAAVFDGYLLNHSELARDLEASGARLRNLSDVEIALRAYEVWGEAFADRLQGEFALVIANLKDRRLLVARDHIGLVPLYYLQEEGRLIVASDFRTIAAIARQPLEPNRHYLAQVIVNRWFLREATPWKDIKRVIRAHYGTYDGEKLAMHNYWVPPTDITIRYKRDEEYVEHYRELLFDCVKRASRADRQIGVAVSGGLDSTSLFCIADRLEKAGALAAPTFQGYAFAAEEGTNAFELPYARAAAKLTGRPLAEVPLFDPDIDWYTQDAEWHMDLPIPSNGAMMLGIDRQVVADGGRVIINGNGGDEWLQGTMQYYREFAAELDLKGLVSAVRRDSEYWGLPTAIKNAMRQSLAELTPGPIRRAIRRDLRKRRKHGRESLYWLAPQWRDALHKAEDAYESILPENAIHWVKHNLAKSPFSDLANSLMRRQRALAGIESRHPMLSRAFMEFSMRTPAYIKREGSLSKVVHRRAMDGILPPEVLERQTKANFTNHKIDCQFADYVREYGPERLEEMCDMEGLQRVLDIDFSTHEGDLWAWEIWGLYATAAFLYQAKA